MPEIKEKGDNTKKSTALNRSIRPKKKKKMARKSCTWYPDFCDAVGCDIDGHPCSDYKKEDTW